MVAVAGAVLIALGSTLTFGGVNASWFTRRQLCGGLVLSAVFGLLVGLALGFAPLPVAGCGLALLFCVMNERMLNNLLRTARRQWVFCLFLLCAGAAVAWAFGLWPHVCLAALVALSGLLDMRKHWHDPRQTVFSAAAFSRSSEDLRSTDGAVWLKEHPNIYVLFLESIHSAEALRTLYDMDDAGVADFLRENNFTVFDGSFSTHTWTAFSLHSLLWMMPQSWTHKGEPEALRILRANGYKVELIDTNLYVFPQYAKYVAYCSCFLPRWISFLYEHAIPFFMQSKCFMRLTANLDPFSDEVDYEAVRGIFEKRSSPLPENPTCYILRFGAGHSPVTYRWPERSQWIATYKAHYAKAASQIKDMVSYILERDPRACIYVMGDHGATSYRGVWYGQGDPNASMLAHGVEPAVVCQDLAGVLQAIRLPDGQPPEPFILSPMNAFRYLFARLGGTGETLTFLPNETFMPETGQLYAYILAREGRALERWEQDNEQTVAVRNARLLQSNPDNVHQIVQLASSLEWGGDWHAALRCLDEGRSRLGNVPELVLPMYYLLRRFGKMQTARALVGAALAESGDKRLVLPAVEGLAMCDEVERARKLLSAEASKLLNKTEQLHVAANMYLGRGDVEKAEEYVRALTQLPHGMHDDLQARLKASIQYAWVLDALGRTAEGREHLLTVLDDAFEPVKFVDIFAVAAALSMRLRDYGQAEDLIRKVLRIMKEPCASLSVWLAGSLEAQGRIEEALAVLEETIPLMSRVPLFTAQIGLFAIRHSLHGARWREAKKEASVYLQDMRQRVAPIFDEGFYRAQVGDLLPEGREALGHFLHHTRLWGFDPCPLFNVLYYTQTEWDIFYQGFDPVWHYLVCSPWESRSPSLRLRTPYYLARHPHVPWPNVNPLCHAMREEQHIGESGAEA